MKIVIDIEEQDYKNIVKAVELNDYPDMNTGRAIVNGAVLPKGYGRLIDADDMLARLHSDKGLPRTPEEIYAWKFAVTLFEKAKTVMGADSDCPPEEITGD